MLFGNDFFKWVQFVMAVLKLLADIFGDDDAQAKAKCLCDQHKDDVA